MTTTSTSTKIKVGATWESDLDIASSGPVTPAVPKQKTRFVCIAVSHAAVDFLAMAIIPLMPVLKGRVEITDIQGANLLALGSICAGIIQPITAWISDKYDTRLPAALGLLMGLLAICSLGFVETYGQMVILQIIATTGIGAYHPVAAASMGRLTESRRSFGVSVFFISGMFGHFVGSHGNPAIVNAFGIQSLLWILIPGILMALVLQWAIHAIPHRTPGEGHGHNVDHLGEIVVPRSNWFAVGTLYLTNVIRFTVNMALMHLVIRWSEQTTASAAGVAVLSDELSKEASLLNGDYQAAMIVGMAIGGFTAGLMVRPRFEKIFLVSIGLFGLPMIACFPWASGWLGYLLAIGSGIGYAASIPVTIAMAQRLLPHRTSLASGLMLGAAWVVAASGPPLAEWLLETWSLKTAYAVVAIMLALSGLICLALPGRLRPVARAKSATARQSRMRNRGCQSAARPAHVPTRDDQNRHILFYRGLDNMDSLEWSAERSDNDSRYRGYRESLVSSSAMSWTTWTAGRGVP